MSEIHAHKHQYRLDALQKLPIEILDRPTGDEGNMLQETGVATDDILTEDGDFLILDGSAETSLTYKLNATKHDYTLDALSQIPFSPSFEIVEGNVLKEDGDALLQEDGVGKILYTDIRGN